MRKRATVAQPKAARVFTVVANVYLSVLEDGSDFVLTISGSVTGHTWREAAVTYCKQAAQTALEEYVAKGGFGLRVVQAVAVFEGRHDDLDADEEQPIEIVFDTDAATATLERKPLDASFHGTDVEDDDTAPLL